jgi:hypothetical protein
VHKVALADPPAKAQRDAASPVIAVYGDDLETIVGFMYPGKGFIPVGVDPESVSPIPAVTAPGL